MDPLGFSPAPLEAWRGRLPEAGSAPRDRQEAQEVAQELEAVFLTELLKSLEATLPSGSLLGDGGSPIRAGMVRDQLARFLARQGGIGLADAILANLTPSSSGSLEPTREETRSQPEKE